MSEADASQPNVLLVCTDHWPGSLLGAAGHPTIRTPTLDQLGASGVRFPNAYSPCPVCMPARRSLWTGLGPHEHGMFANQARRLPEGIPPLAQAFRDQGYQAYGVGKMEVFPTRSRAGFDETVVDFEGRGFARGELDDYELFLADRGQPGQRFSGGMCTNDYMVRPWHLDEPLHVTNWTAWQMSRAIARRDPDKPAFWFLSFSKPHPPLDPPRDYLDLYRGLDVPEPAWGAWSADPGSARTRRLQGTHGWRDPGQIAEARRGFYALCTHIDHQLRVVLGTLREHGLLENTIVCFTSDHGDMLGDHGMWAKSSCYEASARIPMIVMGTRRQMTEGPVGHGRVDERLVSLEDLYPTLLSLAGLPVPGHVTGRDVIDGEPRETLSSAFGTGRGAQRMVRDARYKLVYNPEGNQRQLFDLRQDPHEVHDLAADPAHGEVLERLTRSLVARLRHDAERAWLDENGELAGMDNTATEPPPPRGLHNQRGLHFPAPAVPWEEG